MRLIIFTDLDGTLLDHGSYSFAEATPALATLRERNIPVVLASSKTAAEIAPLRGELGLSRFPAIVENGAGLLPPGSLKSKGNNQAYRQIRDALCGIDPDLRGLFEGFADLGPAGISRATGLAPEQAALAACRQYSEPGLWHGDDASEVTLAAALKPCGIQARRGGRFLTLSHGGSKAGRMEEVAASFASSGELIVTVALGDAPNDTEMLEAADHGIVVRNPHGTPLPELDGESSGRITRTELPGPAGWNSAILAVLEETG